MLLDTPPAVCSCCLGVPCGTVPSGALQGRPACSACLDAIREACPSPQHVVELRPASASFEAAVFATGQAAALRRLVEEMPRELDHGELRCLSVIPERCLVPLWHASAGERTAELLDGLREAAGAAGVDLRISPALTVAARHDEERPAARAAGAA